MRGIVVLVLAVASANAAAAQSVVFLSEGMMDFGRLTAPPSAEILALGGMGMFGFETAVDGAVNPAALMRGPRSDVVVAAAINQVSRDVFFRSTVDANNIATHERRWIAGPRSKTGFVAAAVRRPQWALGAFYDGSTRLRHAFTTGQRTISQITSPGGAAFSQTTGRTESSTQIDVSRVGGSFAMAAFEGRIAAGAGVEAIRFHANAHSVSDFESLSALRGRPPVTSRSTETRELKADEWKSGVTIGGAWNPASGVGITVVRRWMPTFATKLVGVRRNLTFGFEEASSQDLTVDGPDAFTVGGTFARGRTKVGGEIVRIDYGILDSSELRSPAASLLRPAGIVTEGSAGIQHRLSMGGSRGVLVRVGFMSKGVHALSTDRPDRFVPEPRRQAWITGGVGFELEQLTLAVSAGRTRDENRVIVTVGIRSR